MHNHHKLRIWKESIEFANEIYVMTRSFPKEELFGITSQIRRSVISIPSNIAEGCGRKSDKEFSNFLAIALGSSYEVETQLLLASRLNYVQQDIFNGINDRLDKIQKTIYNLIKKNKPAEKIDF